MLQASSDPYRLWPLDALTPEVQLKSVKALLLRGCGLRVDPTHLEPLDARFLSPPEDVPQKEVVGPQVHASVLEPAGKYIS